MSDPLWMNAASDTTVGTATIAAATDLFTIASHGLNQDDRIVVSNLTGGAVGVVADGGVYWVRDVTTDDFAVTLTKGGLPLDFSVNGGADVDRYQPGLTARELRQLIGGLTYQASADRFGAREGILPSQSLNPVLVAGTAWSVPDIRAVVYPGINSLDGPYLVAHPDENGSTVAADGVDDRIDALDLQIQDDDNDSSGFRRARIVYVTGTPATTPSPPALTTNALRLATILVPASGTPSPSVQTQALMTAAAGGVSLVRDDTELPTSPTDGNSAYNLQTGGLLVRQAGSWNTLGSIHGYQFGGRQVYTTDGSFTKANFPGLRAVDITVIGGGGGAGGCASTGSGEGSEGAGGAGGSGAKGFKLASDLAATETVTVGNGGNGASAGANQGSDGTESRFTVTNGTDIQADGGGGGFGGTAQGQSGNTVASGGFPTGSSGGDINEEGSKGGNGVVMKGETVKLNFGGAAAFGFGGARGSAAFDSGGAAGSTFGGGAGGPRNNDTAGNRPGQDGATGIVIVELYY